MSRRWTPAAVPLVLALLAACGEAPAETTPSPPAAIPALSPAPAAPAARPAAVAEQPKLFSDQWYRTLRDGQPSGWLHVKWTHSTYQGKPSVHDRTEAFSLTTRKMGSEENTFESRTISDLDRTDDGLLLRMESREVQGERVEKSLEEWNGKGYELTRRVSGTPETRSVACDAPCPVDPEAYLSLKLQKGEVAVGNRFEYKAPNFEGNRLDTVTLDVEAKETLTLGSGEFACFRVVEKVAGTPADATWWFDSTGVLRRERSGQSGIESTTEAHARDVREGGAVFSITIDADPEMPRCTSLDRAVVDVTIEARDGIAMPEFPKTPFSRELSRKGSVIRLELSAHDEPGQAVVFPVTDPKLAKFLERTTVLCTDSARVKAAVKEAIGDEKDARQAVRKILRYVFVTLRMSAVTTAGPTADEILEQGCGFCAEHCVLFVTMCRAAGIPARRLSGYAQVGDMWGAHAFSEVWLGGWVGCDATTNEFGTKARYIAFGWDDDPDSFPGIVSSRAAGRMAIHTAEFSEGGHTWKTEGLANPSDREDLLSGLVLAKPPERWNANVGDPGRGHVSGPGVRADLSVHAGMGDLPCDVLSRQMFRGWKRAQFGGHDVLRDDVAVQGRITIQMMIPYRRRMLQVRMHVDDAKNADAALATLAVILAPTLD